MDEWITMAAGLGFPEGPVACADGSVLLVEIETGWITRVHDDGRTDRDQQNVARDSHVAMSCGWRWKAHDEWRRQFVVHDIAWQRPPVLPLLRLPGRHAAIVLLREPWRTAPVRSKLAIVVVVNDHALPVIEVPAAIIIPRVALAMPLAFVVPTVLVVTLALVVVFVRKRRHAADHTQTQRHQHSSDHRHHVHHGPQAQ